MPNAQMSGVYKLLKMFLEIWYNFGPIHNEKYFFSCIFLAGVYKLTAHQLYHPMKKIATES